MIVQHKMTRERYVCNSSLSYQRDIFFEYKQEITFRTIPDLGREGTGVAEVKEGSVGLFAEICPSEHWNIMGMLFVQKYYNTPVWRGKES